jgi:hypothetical protein
MQSLPGCDAEGRRLAANLVSHSGAVYHGEVVSFLMAPKFYTEHELDRFHSVVQTTYEILRKVTEHYVSDPAYRAQFTMSPLAEELILLDPGYDCFLPIARLDLFYNEASGDFQFCEFNTDGTSAMNEDREISAALSQTPTFARFTESYTLRRPELIDSWVETFRRIYATSMDALTSPRMAIVDFLDLTTPYEIALFAERFNAAGMDTAVFDVRELRFDGRELRGPDGRCIDVIYRRAVTTDILARADQVRDFLDAVRAQAVRLIGSFRTQVTQNKQLFSVIQRPETLAFLTADEADFVRRHFPFTTPLTDLQGDTEQWERLIADKDRWILKPLDSYGAHHVVAGRERDPEAWRRLLSERAQTGDYLVQRYVKPFRTPNIRPEFTLVEGEDVGAELRAPCVERYNELVGLFVYAGEFKGFLVRAGQEATISAAAGGYTLGTFELVT